MKLDSPTFLRLSQLRPVKKSESLVGYLFESVHNSGWTRMKDMVEELVGRQVIQPPWTVPTNLRAICEHLSPVFRSPEQILEEHTCLPAHLPFISAETREMVMRHVMNGDKQMGVASMVGLGGPGISSKPEFALCPLCLKEDKLLGSAPWRREHQLAGLGYCPHHGVPLLVGCRKCYFSQRASRIPQLPRLLCKCGEPRKLSHESVSDADGAVLTRMARLGLQLLEGGLNGWSAHEVTGYYHLAAREHGLSFGGRFKTVELVKRLRGRYSPAVLTRLNAGLSSDRNWVPLVFGKNGASCVLGRNLLLLDYFGPGLPGSERLLECRRYMKTWRPATKGQSRAPAEAMVKSDDRARILDYIRDHPQATRSELLTELGRVVTRVREHDSAWYDAVLPGKPAGRAADTQEEREAYLQELDDRTAAHVLRRRDELLSVGGRDPHRITKTALLNGATRGNEVTEELLKLLPKTREAIQSAEESPRQYKVRFAKTILRLSRGDAYTVERAHVRTGLTVTHVRQLNAEVLAEEVALASKKKPSEGEE